MTPASKAWEAKNLSPAQRRRSEFIDRQLARYGAANEETLLDKYAAAALTAMVSGDVDHVRASNSKRVAYLAANAFAIAAAMLEERARYIARYPLCARGKTDGDKGSEFCERCEGFFCKQHLQEHEDGCKAAAVSA